MMQLHSYSILCAMFVISFFILSDMSLTEDQKKRVEESRQKALALRASRQQNLTVSCTPAAVGQNVASRTPLNANAIMCSAARVPESYSSNKPNYDSRLTDRGGTKNSSFAERKRPVNGSTLTNGKSSLQSIFVYAKSSSSTGSTLKSIPTTDSVVAKCILMSRHRFMVDVRYCPPVIEVFKTMATKQYGS